MKICLLTSSFPRKKDGFEGIFILELAENLHRAGHSVTVVTPRYAGSLPEEEFNNIKVRRFKFLGWRKDRVLAVQKRIHFFSTLSLILRMFLITVKTVRRNDIDVLHCFWAIPAGFVGVLVKKLLKVPVVITSPGSDLNIWAEKKVPGIIIKYAVKKTDALITVSSRLKDKVLALGVNPSRVQPVPGNGGINMSLFKPDDKGESIKKEIGISDEKVILYIGRLSLPKRVDVLIKAAGEVKKMGVNFKMIVVGDGDNRKELEEVAHNMGISKEVLFLGGKSHKDIRKYLAVSDVFVFASENEGLPTVIMEAMASGVPVVAGDVGGVSDLIKEGHNGHIVKRNDVKGFAERIAGLLRNEASCVEMGANARQFVLDNLDREVIIPRVVNVYNSITE